MDTPLGYKDTPAVGCKAINLIKQALKQALT